MTAHIEEVNDGNFAKIVLGATGPILVDFWARWCGPCRALAPVVEAVAEQYAGSAQVVKLNVDNNPSVVEKFRIAAIPTLSCSKMARKRTASSERRVRKRSQAGSTPMWVTQ